ncbi:MAG TPA: hypothetical protein VFV24_11355 [Candidatus Eisenbacteria bacterium]|nr:hypothetical protein [Candidatus Eisenbacteria bacterium]
MAGEPTTDGYLIRLKSCGVGRFFGAAFLLFWLCGWAFGEAFALWMIGTGAAALVNGETPPGGPAQTAPLMAIGAFILFWLVLWTFAGIMAMKELVRLLWGEDRILARGSGLEVTRMRGPFRASKEYPRDIVRGFLISPKYSALAMETDKERIELSRLGTLQGRLEAVKELQRELALGESLATPSSASNIPAILPQGWEETITPEGERALVPDQKTRKIQARVVGALTLAMAIATLAAISGSITSPALIPGAVMALLGTLGLAWGTLWLARGRKEWKIGGGRLVLRRRFGPSLKDEFVAERLEITVHRDSDGDEWFALEAVTGPEPTIDFTKPMEAARHARKHRRQIASVIHDPMVPMRLGAWLSRAAGVPLEDRTTRHVRQLELTVLKGQLDASGPLGKFALKLIEKAEAKKAGES